MAFNQINSLEFSEIKAQIRSYLKAQSEFSDYDFDGSSLSVLLDILAYNTYYSSVNANLLVNENFIESAVLRENVVKLAKLVGYTPTSARSARAKFNISIQTTFPYPKTITLTKGICFSFEGADNDTYIFSIPSDVIASVDTLSGVATISNLVTYEGLFVKDTFVKDTSTRQRFILTNENADTTTLKVEITRGLITEAYLKATDITQVKNTTKTYFLEESEYNRPEIIFGDGVIGEALIDTDVIECTYSVSTGSNPNGLTGFSFIGNIRDSANIPITSGITVTMTTSPDGGAEPEDINSIKFAAPKFYSSFGRAVTNRDYETIIPQIYPNVQSVAVFGGEDADPVEYGKVIVVIKPKNADKLSISEKEAVLRKLKGYTVAAIEPKIIDPSVLYIDLNSYVYFNPNATRRSQDDIKSIVYANLNALNSNSDFNNFGGKFKYSKLVKIIDDSEPAITSNITRVKMRKNVPITLNSRVNYKVCYGNRINAQLDTPSVMSSGFKIADGGDIVYYLNDDGLGLLRLFFIQDDGSFSYVGGNWGTVDYMKGEIVINDIIVTSALNTSNIVQLSVVPESNDLISLRETYLTIGMDNLVVNVLEDVISSGDNPAGTGVIPESSYS